MIREISPAPPHREPPNEFDVYELIVLRRALDAPHLDEATENLIQSHHLGHFAAMKDAGYLRSPDLSLSSPMTAGGASACTKWDH